MICVHDIIAITGLAVTVSIAYKDASNDCRHISEEVSALKLLIERVAPHFKTNTISQEDYHYGEKILKDCQSVLGDLNSFIGKYRRLASINKRLVLNRVKLGKVDITALHVQLISKTVLLKSFVRSCEYVETQARLAALLGLHSNNQRISVTSIPAFAANTNTETAFEQFCKELYQIGATKDMIRQKGDKILEILTSQGMVTSSQIGGSSGSDAGDKHTGDENTGDEDPVLETAYKEYCKDLYSIGVTEDMIRQNEGKIRDILRSRGMVASNNAGGSNAGGSNAGGSNIGDRDGNASSTNVMPTFRLSSQINWFQSNSEAIDEHTSLVHLAADNSHSGAFELLIRKGASIDEDNNTLLHFAAGGGYTDTVKLLLDKGTPIETRNIIGFAPLHFAAISYRPSVIKLLLAKGALIDAQDDNGETALHQAAWRGHTGIVDLLLREGAAIEVGNKRGNTPLYKATQMGHTNIVKLLLEKGSSTETKLKDGETPLHAAAWSGYTGLAELLLEKGASIEARCEDSSTPLHFAARKGHTGVMELLLKKGASIEAKLGRGCTPLHLAALYSHTAAVELLIQKGALLEVINYYGRTPLDFAESEGETGIVQLLKNNKAGLAVRGTHG